MSQSIRNLIHHYIENEVTDDRLSEVADLMMESGDKGHKIPLAISVGFIVDKDGIMKVEIGHSFNMKSPVWDKATMIRGGQLNLVVDVEPPLLGNPKVTPIATKQPAESGPEKTKDPAPPIVSGGDPDKRTIVAGPAKAETASAIGDVPGAPESQSARIARINAGNAGILERVKKGELVLDPSAQAALEAESRGAKNN